MAVFKAASSVKKSKEPIQQSNSNTLKCPYLRTFTVTAINHEKCLRINYMNVFSMIFLQGEIYMWYLQAVLTVLILKLLPKTSSFGRYRYSDISEF